MKKINKKSTRNSPLNRKLRKFYELKQFANNVIKDDDVKKATMKYCDKEINKCWRYCRENKPGYEIFTWHNSQIFPMNCNFETAIYLISHFIGKTNRDINVVVDFEWHTSIKTQATMNCGVYRLSIDWLMNKEWAQNYLFKNPEVKVSFAEWTENSVDRGIGTIRFVINHEKNEQYGSWRFE